MKGKLVVKTIFLCLVSFIFLMPVGLNAQTVLFDDFQRANNNTVGNTWAETETVSPTGANITSNQLKLGSITSGRDYILADVSAQYNTVFNSNTSSLTWAFNVRQTRADPSGFDAGNYGVAFVLGSSLNSFTSGSGYAVVLGNSGTGDNLRLVRFSNGISTSAGLTNIIAPVIDYGSEYLTVKVTYNPVGNNWSLYIGSNTGFFDDPATAIYSQLGTTTSDNTYTGIDLLYLGCFWNHNTSSTDFAYFDNIRIPSACSLSPEPLIQSSGLNFSSTGANSVTLNWTRGDGSNCIVIAHQGGPVTTSPVDGAAYYGSTVFGSGTVVAPNEYVVYTGSANSITITGLSPTTLYYFSIFEFNGSGCTTNYLLTTPASSSVTTTACIMAAQPTIQSSGLIASNILTNSLDLNWTRGNGVYCIVVGKSGSAITTSPTDGSSYTASSIFGIGSTTTFGEYVIYSGTGNSVAVTGVLPNTTYYFAVYEMNGTGCITNYLNSPAATGNATTLNAASYNYYFGNLHAHSDYSDGDMDNVCNGAGSATCCYDIGNTALNFDYMGISDHNHNEGPVMTPTKYANGLAEAANYNSTHIDFVAFYGMEWGTISTGGHTNIYGINQLVGWNTGNYNVYCAKGDYNTLFNLVASTPNAFATLCHPNTTDYGNLLGIPYNTTYDNAIVGVAVRNGPYNSTNVAYADPSAGSTVSYYNNMLSKGYHVAPTADLDNHNSATMGKSSQQRTVLLATARTSQALLDAILNMRFYASDDYNLQLSFTINGSIVMGSIASQTSNPAINVSTNDPDLETTASIKIYYGVPGSNALPTLLTSVSNASSLNFTHAFATGTYYYYAEITQADGNMAWTAPIWYTKTAPLPIELLSFTGEHIHSGNLLEWTTASEINNDFFALERSTDGINFKEIKRVKGAGTSSLIHQYSYLDKSYSSSMNFYRLKQTDFNGDFAYSGIILIRTETKNAILIYPNPAVDFLTVDLTSIDEAAELRITDVSGKMIYQTSAEPQQKVKLSTRILAEGIYLLRIRTDHFVDTEKILIRK